MQSVIPQQRVGAPLLGGIAEDRLDLRAHVIPGARLASVGYVDDRWHPLEQLAVSIGVVTELVRVSAFVCVPAFVRHASFIGGAGDLPNSWPLTAGAVQLRNSRRRPCRKKSHSLSRAGT